MIGAWGGAAAPGTGPIVAFGDSYTEGWGAAPEEAYPAALSRALGRPVLNRGVSGETAREGLRRFDRDVAAHRPALVLVGFGVNEAFRGQPVEAALRALDEIAQRCAALPARVVLVGVRYRHFGAGFDEGLRALAARHRTGLVLDALRGIVGEDGDAALRSDESHPNAAGYAILAQRVEPEVRRVLAA